jgi:hypothetical protein
MDHADRPFPEVSERNRPTLLPPRDLFWLFKIRNPVHWVSHGPEFVGALAFFATTFDYASLGVLSPKSHGISFLLLP